MKEFSSRVSDAVRVFVVLVLGALSPIRPTHASTWSVKPAYETANGTKSSSFSIVDDRGTSRQLYDKSHAVLILEGNYLRAGGFSTVPSSALTSERLLRERLEERGFEVTIWRDLGSRQFKNVLDEVFSTWGHEANSRFFFYYFGHGQVIGTDSDDAGPRTYLVPVDAPNPVQDEAMFERFAIPITQIVAYAQQATFRHAFFAFEACKAGAVVTSLASLDGPAAPRPKGYLLSRELLRISRQFLTAGNDVQVVPANNSFTAVLAGALSDKLADVNGDGYVTGDELMLYVKTRLPNFATSYPLTPETGKFPMVGGGDMVFGPLIPVAHAPTAVASLTPVVATSNSRVPSAPRTPSGEDNGGLKVTATAIAVPTGRQLSAGPEHRFTVSLVAPNDLSAVESVQYTFDHPTFHEKVITARDPSNRFAYSYVGFGCLYIVGLKVELKDGTTHTSTFDMCRSIGWGQPSPPGSGD